MTAVAAEPEWVTRERVAVYDQHVLEIIDKRTGEVAREEKVDADRLQRIADRRNAKIERSGDESPIIIGHTRPGKPEWEQPPIVGYADKYEVAPHEKDGRPTLYCRIKLYPESKVGGETMTADEILRRFPRRSPEVWLDDEDDLDAISLLGPTTPARYHGLVRNSKIDQLASMAKVAQPARYAREPQMDKCAELIAALQNVLAQFAGAPDGGAPPPEGDLPPMDQPVAYAAGGAAAMGPTNAALTAPADLEKVRMARVEDAKRIRQLTEREKARDAEVADMKVRMARSERSALRANRKADLMSDIEDGIQLDLDEELDLVAPADIESPAMSEDQYAGYRTRIQKRYQRQGVSGGFVRTAESDTSQTDPTKAPPYHERARQLMRSKPGMQYTEALAEVSR